MTRRHRLARAGVLLGGLALMASSCTSSDADPARFCQLVAEVPVVSDRDDLAVPDPATATEELVVAVQRVHGASPDEVSEPLGVMVDVLEAVQLAVTADPGPERDDARREVDERQAEWKSASDQVVAYAAQRCDIDLTAPR